MPLIVVNSFGSGDIDSHVLVFQNLVSFDIKCYNLLLLENNVMARSISPFLILEMLTGIVI